MSPGRWRARGDYPGKPALAGARWTRGLSTSRRGWTCTATPAEKLVPADMPTAAIALRTLEKMREQTDKEQAAYRL